MKDVQHEGWGCTQTSKTTGIFLFSVNKSLSRATAKRRVFLVVEIH